MLPDICAKSDIYIKDYKRISTTSVLFEQGFEKL